MKKLHNFKKYSTYNQITKENDVIILSYEDYDKLPQNIKLEVRFIMAIRKDLIDNDDTPPKWFLVWAKQNKLEMDSRFLEIKQYIDKKIDDLDYRLDNIVKLNNLKE